MIDLRKNYTPQGHVQIMDWPTLKEAIRKRPGTFHVYVKHEYAVIGTAILEPASFELSQWLKFEIETIHDKLKFVKPMPEHLNN